MPTPLIRPMSLRAETLLFLPTGATTVKPVPLPTAPPVRTTLPLAPGGIHLLTGRAVSSILSAALADHDSRHYVPYSVTMRVEIARALHNRQLIEADTLPDIDLVVAEEPRAGTTLAELVHKTLLRLIKTRELPPPSPARLKLAPRRFALLADYPQLLQPLMRQKPFKHLSAFIYTLPKSDQTETAHRLLYLRDPSLLQDVNVIGPDGLLPWRAPIKTELAKPLDRYNPFTITR